MYQYSLLQWILIFYVYCFLGWCFETTVVSVQQGHFVNRGFLQGPMLPIYGFGAVMLLFVSIPLQQKPILLFFACAIAATAFEYVVGAIMETMFKVRYWDYSDHKYQLDGYICLQSAICWGVLGLGLERFIHLPVALLIQSLPHTVLTVLTALVSLWLAYDVMVSVYRALDLAKFLKELDKLHRQSAMLRKELAKAAKVKLTTLSYRVEEAYGEWSGSAEESTRLLREKISKSQKLIEDRMKGLKGKKRNLLRGNPTASSKRYETVLRLLKERAGQYKKH